jgi:hypothetical protein
MKKASWAVTLLILAGLMAVPTYAAELRVTGFFDNILPHVDRNLSMQDQDLTNNHDTNFNGRERSRFFFNFIASDDLRGVFALEIDQSYGAPSRNQVGSRCVPDAANATTISGQRVLLQNFDACGFRNQIDNNALELKNLYVDFRVPQLGIGNRWQIGGIPADVTPLHPHLIFTMDSGGGNVKFDFSDQVSLLLHYIQLEEDLDVNKNNTLINSTITRRGEDYLSGGTLQLKPIPGLDLHLIGLYGHLHAPFGMDIGGTGGSSAWTALPNGTTNIATESRYYLGFDSRYRLGDLSIEPTFIYLLGTRKFTSASAARTGFSDTDIRAFETQLAFQYTRGPWYLAGKGAYTSGQKAEDDINNQGFVGTKRSDVKIFRQMSVDGFHRFGEYLEILGRQEADGVGTTLVSTGTPGEAGTWNRYGLIVGSAKAEYQWTDSLVLEGAAGTFWSAEKTGCEAVLRTGPNGACATTGATIQQTGRTFNPFNFTSNSRHLGEEVDVGFRYTILPGLVWQQRFGWAFLGDGMNQNNRKAQDVWEFINRVLYTF